MVTVMEGGRPTTPRTELAAILASTHDAVVGSTPSGVINGWNPAAALLCGYTAEEARGRHVQDLVAPHRRAEDAKILGRLVRGGQAEQYDTAWVCKDGSVVGVSLTASAIVDAGGAVVGAVMVSCKRGAPPEVPDPMVASLGHGLQADADKELLDAHLQQAQRLEVLGRLAGGVAHDFNNLLGVILNFAAFVTEELESAPRWDRREMAQRDVGQIKRAAERAAELTHQLLAFARQEVVTPRVLHLHDAVS